MMNIRNGYFKLLNPTLSKKGYIICGAVVGVSENAMYTCRCSRWSDVAKTEDTIRKKILADHPGIQEEWSPSRMFKAEHRFN